MNYPSRRGIRLNLKQVGGREGSSGKLIQTTRCPPPTLPPDFFFFFPPARFPRCFFPLFSRQSHPPLPLPPSPPPSSPPLPPPSPSSFSLALWSTRSQEKERRSKLFRRRIPPIKMPRGAGINLASTSIPSNVTARHALISVRSCKLKLKIARAILARLPFPLPLLSSFTRRRCGYAK